VEAVEQVTLLETGLMVALAAMVAVELVVAQAHEMERLVQLILVAAVAVEQAAHKVQQVHQEMEPQAVQEL
jgi:hypothetical protein